jgi:hypothetical protein
MRRWIYLYATMRQQPTTTKRGTTISSTHYQKICRTQHTSLCDHCDATAIHHRLPLTDSHLIWVRFLRSVRWETSRPQIQLRLGITWRAAASSSKNHFCKLAKWTQFVQLYNTKKHDAYSQRSCASFSGRCWKLRDDFVWRSTTAIRSST